METMNSIPCKVKYIDRTNPRFVPRVPDRDLKPVDAISSAEQAIDDLSLHSERPDGSLISLYKVQHFLFVYNRRI